MEHYLIYGLAALVIFLLLMSVGPRSGSSTRTGDNGLFSPTSNNGFPKPQSPE